MLARVLRNNAPPWERSILELIIELDVPDWKGIKEQLARLQRDSISR